jgi:hypothetical protein
VASADSVADFTRLPYAERIVNVLVVDLDVLGDQAPPEAELRRVVALQAGSTTILQSYARDDGRPLGECSLEHPPLRDGLVAAGGKLYLSTADAQVLCLGEKSE